MTASEPDQQIAQAQEQEHRHRDVAEFARQQFIDVATAHLAEWYPATIEQTVKQNLGVTQRNAAAGRLVALRKVTNELVSNRGKLVQEAFEHANYWPHRALLEDRVAVASPFEASEAIDLREKAERTVKELLGQAQRLLQEYGYSSGSLPSSWSRDMEGAWEEYCNSLRLLADARRQLASLWKQRDEAKAKDLWDAAA